MGEWVRGTQLWAKENRLNIRYLDHGSKDGVGASLLQGMWRGDAVVEEGAQWVGSMRE
jgi:hypothetical protein